MRKTSRILLAMLLVMVLAPAAFAGLSAVGPFNPPVTSNGFPQWYKDANGVSVELPIPPAGDGLTAPTMIYAPLTPNSNAVARRAGFDTEAFYFNARPDPKTYQTAYGKIVAVFGLEASYANGTPTDGQQIVFARIRIKAPVKVAGTYTFSHPWGSEVITVTQADINSKNKGIFFTKDIGLTLGWLPNADGITFSPAPSPGGFYNVLTNSNSMSTFLRAATPAPPPDWIGDGVTLTTVTGSPLAIPYNKVRLQGPDPNLDGKGNNFVETDKFVVSGKIPASTTVPLALSVDRATCSYIGTVEDIDLFLTSVAGAAIQVKDANTGAILFNNGAVSATGKFYASFPGTTKSITVTGTLAGFTPITKTVPVIDYVNITSAAYSLGGNSLTVTATSSDWLKHPLTPPVLTVTGFGTMAVDTLGVYTLGPVAVTATLPPTITVSSTTGGSDSIAVAITP